ncbi:hypothetical protein C8A03DRAFT_17147 [Achaetomium macrosporum]|uniref:UBC core domain-containing protein n=1 Tax=Achaetomium macrosporum TaxID=79813 RepID=A0AAN7C7H0_9PEZI|nr:hypothetical protein C8A03DRAFT_17147 [Achaetomium macrosporum]
MVQGKQGFRDSPVPDPSSLGLNELAVYRQSLLSLRCVNCSNAIKVTDTEVIQRTKKMLGESCFFHPCVKCTKCKGWSCVGGDTYHASANIPVLSHVASAKGVKLTWCCDQGRLFLIFSILCGFSAIPKPPPAKRNLRPRPQPSVGVVQSEQSGAKSSALSKGTGYGGPALHVFHSPLRRDRRSQKVQARQEGNDDVSPELIEHYFLGLSSVLPSPTKEAATAFDCRPQPSVSAMILRSPLLQHASELLRYAAIEEINTWRGTTTAVLNFMEIMGSHAGFAPLLIRERTIFPPEDQLIKVVLGNTETQGTARRTAYESGQSLAAIVEHLAVPCRKFLEGLCRYAKTIEQQPKQEKESVALATQVAVAQQISRLADFIASYRVQMNSVMAGQETCADSASSWRSWNPHITGRAVNAKATQAHVATASQDNVTALCKWHRANCVKDLPDHVILEGHHYEKQAGELVGSNPSVGRMRKLLAQISSLSTDLPEGIYVRHGESRLDVLKILISGPTGTPYENGLFEFDMFCDHEFPEKAPKMHFRTTGGGHAAFNPNLYPNGKICLSLLGTWSGHPWEPDRSTILQILVSIQSMIFNAQPYYNEPGREHHRNDSSSEKYNRTVERQTVQYALLPWLTQRLANRHKSSESDTSAPSIPRGTPPVQVPVEASLNLANMAPSPAHDTVYHDPHLGLIPTAPSSIVPVWHPPPLTTAHQIQEAVQAPMHASIFGWANVTAVLPGCGKSNQASLAPLKEDDPIWGDVIRKHFEIKSIYIVERVQQWEKRAPEDARPGLHVQVTQFAQQLREQLTKQLKEHGFLA